MEKEFVNGLYFKEPTNNMPEYIIGKLSAKREELINFLKSKEDEWVNMVIKRKMNKEGYYIQVDNWKPNREGRTDQPEHHQTHQNSYREF